MWSCNSYIYINIYVTNELLKVRTTRTSHIISRMLYLIESSEEENWYSEAMESFYLTPVRKEFTDTESDGKTITLLQYHIIYVKI